MYSSEWVSRRSRLPPMILILGCGLLKLGCSSKAVVLGLSYLTA